MGFNDKPRLLLTKLNQRYERIFNSVPWFYIKFFIFLLKYCVEKYLVCMSPKSDKILTFRNIILITYSEIALGFTTSFFFPSKTWAEKMWQKNLGIKFSESTKSNFQNQSSTKYQTQTRRYSWDSNEASSMT